ncbi:MAG TPA: hypothetical protein PKO15_06205, partial [Fibrobacteria bacterium]|nr:hypothetical protein [Fibrobacteria bacterium]
FTVSFGAGSAIVAVAAIFTVSFGAGSAIVAVAAIFTVSFGAGSAIAFGAIDGAKPILEFVGELVLVPNHGIADFAEEFLDFQEYEHDESESDDLEGQREVNHGCVPFMGFLC